MTPPASKNILLCTLGATWAVIPKRLIDEIRISATCATRKRTAIENNNLAISNGFI